MDHFSKMGVIVRQVEVPRYVHVLYSNKNLPIFLCMCIHAYKVEKLTRHFDNAHGLRPYPTLN
jgi:hypothetical protein